MIDDVTVDKSSRMNSKVYKALLSTQIQPHAAQQTGSCFTVHVDNDLKRSFMLQRNGIFFSGQVNQLISVQWSMVFIN